MSTNDSTDDDIEFVIQSDSTESEEAGTGAEVKSGIVDAGAAAVDASEEAPAAKDEADVGAAADETDPSQAAAPLDGEAPLEGDTPPALPEGGPSSSEVAPPEGGASAEGEPMSSAAEPEGETTPTGEPVPFEAPPEGEAPPALPEVESPPEEEPLLFEDAPPEAPKGDPVLEAAPPEGEAPPTLSEGESAPPDVPMSFETAPEESPPASPEAEPAPLEAAPLDGETPPALPEGEIASPVEEPLPSEAPPEEPVLLEAAPGETVQETAGDEEEPPPDLEQGSAEASGDSGADDEAAPAPDMLLMLRNLKTLTRSPHPSPQPPVATPPSPPELPVPHVTPLQVLAHDEGLARATACEVALTECEMIGRSFIETTALHTHRSVHTDHVRRLFDSKCRELVDKEEGGRSELHTAMIRSNMQIAAQKKDLEKLRVRAFQRQRSPPSPCHVLWNDSAACLCASLMVLHAASAHTQAKRRLGWTRRAAACTIQRCWRVDRAVTMLKRLKHRKVKMQLINEEMQSVVASAVLIQSIVRRWMAAARTQLLKEERSIAQRRDTAAALIQATWKDRRLALRSKRDAKKMKELEYEAAALRCTVETMKQERQGLVKTIETLRRENNTLHEMEALKALFMHEVRKEAPKVLPSPPSPPDSPPPLPVGKCVSPVRSVRVQELTQAQTQTDEPRKPQRGGLRSEIPTQHHNDPLDMSPQSCTDERDYESTASSTSILISALEMARLKDQIILEQLRLLNNKTLTTQSPESPVAHLPLEIQQHSAPVSPQDYERRPHKYKRHSRIRTSTLAEVLMFNPRPTRLGRRAYGRMGI